MILYKLYIYIYIHICIYICVCVCVFVCLNKLFYHIFPPFVSPFLKVGMILRVFHSSGISRIVNILLKTEIISHETNFLHFYIVQNSSYFHQMIFFHVTKILGNSSNPVLVKATQYDQNKVINFVL
jgi:hypothetical protein